MFMKLVQYSQHVRRILYSNHYTYLPHKFLTVVGTGLSFDFYDYEFFVFDAVIGCETDVL